MLCLNTTLPGTSAFLKFSVLVINLRQLLSFKGEGEDIYREGLRPSLTYTGALNPLPLLREGGQGDRLLNNLLRCREGDKIPLFS